MAVAVCGFVSCSCSESSGNKETKEVTDTTVVVRGGTSNEGFGRCSESGCHCKAFKGRGQTCGNCGHAYRAHY